MSVLLLSCIYTQVHAVTVVTVGFVLSMGEDECGKKGEFDFFSIQFTGVPHGSTRISINPETFLFEKRFFLFIYTFVRFIKCPTTLSPQSVHTPLGKADLKSRHVVSYQAVEEC